MPDFEVNDRRGQPRQASDWSLSRTMTVLRNRGFALPNNPALAKVEARNAAAAVDNRTLASSMRRTAADVQMALPKVRQPMSTLSDKGIPFDTTKPKELKEIRRWARLFYATHDLIPLLIDIYSKFPLIGMEFTSKDPQIKDFYESMFLDTLDYETFLQDVAREYFISGEVNSLGHFDEMLGIWSSEEVLNPDALSVSKSMFVQRERVQLLVKDLVEALRDGATDAVATEDGPTRSEQMEKRYELEQLQRNYPEIMQAAQSGDGLDIADALISRMVNKVQPWDLRGTPHMLRSFRTLMMEESLNSAQDAVADRLYSPLVLATLGIPNLGDGEPWIPDQMDLENCRDDLQQALAADFRLMVHNFGLDIKSVFGREAVPRFDQDYNRIDKKLMQAWGIGEALISGGSAGSGNTYASSALNREFITQMLVTFQKAVKKHIKKRCEVIAEAQEHYDYETSGDMRKPVFREIVEEDPETGEMYARKVPRLLIPEVKFQTLNLRDEAQERSFLQQLRNAGVPISDSTLAVNIPMEFEEELEKKSEETVAKLVAEAQAMQKAFHLAAAQGLPIPPDIAKYYAAGSQLQKELSGTDLDKAKAKSFEETGINPDAPPGLPGQPPVPGQPGELPPGGAVPEPGAPPAKQPPAKQPPQLQQPKTPLPVAASLLHLANGNGGPPEGGGGGDSSKGDSNPFGVDLNNGIGENQLDLTKGFEPTPGEDKGWEQGDVPVAMEETPVADEKAAPLAPRNRTRPPESDEQRKNSPRSSALSTPTSVGAARRASLAQVEAAVARLSSPHQTVRDLVDNDEFFASLNRQSYMEQIRADIDTIYLDMVIAADGNGTYRSGDRNAAESFAVLAEMIDQHEETFGFRPEW